MLAQQMLSFEKRHSIQAPSLTHAQELRAISGAKRRQENEQRFPRRSRSRGNIGARGGSSLPELERGSPGAEARRKRRGRRRPVGKGARSLMKLEEMHDAGALSNSEYREAKLKVHDTVKEREADPAADAPEEVPDEVDDGAGADAEPEAADGDMFESMSEPEEEVYEEPEIADDEPFVAPVSTNMAALVGNMPLLNALQGGGGYERPDTAEIIEDLEELPQLTPRAVHTEGFKLVQPPPKTRQSLGRAALAALEAENAVRPSDFQEASESDDASSQEGEDALDGPSETEWQRILREKQAAQKQLVRAPSRGSPPRAEVPGFGLVGPNTQREFWWKEKASSAEVTEHLAVATEPDKLHPVDEAPAGGAELFFGTKGRVAFFDLSKAQHSKWNAEGATEDGEGPDSGRRNYIR
eukprot:COSAG04_NODE_5449_length_1616_cov_2.299275_1_plen_411_part_01